MATSVSGIDLERFEILERSPGLIGIHTLQGRLLYINPAAAAALGYAAAEMIGRDFQEFLAEPVRPYFLIAMRQLLNAGSGRGITSVVTRDGRERSWFFRHVIWQQDPEPIVLADSTDLTDLHVLDDVLHEDDGPFRFLAENTRQVFWVRDPRQPRLLYLSPAFEEVWRRPRDEFIERPELFIETIHPDDRGAVSEGLLRAGAGQYSEGEWRILRPDSSVRWIRGRTFPARDQVGHIDRLISITEDVTEQHDAAEELRRAKEAAEGATRAKSEFLANVSHELRTPLNVVFGMTEMLLDTPLDKHQRFCVQRSRAAMETLVTLVQDLVDLSRIEAGRFDLRPRPFDLRETVSAALDPFADTAERNGVHLHAKISSHAPDTLFGDPDRLRQILVNLIGNAIKFTAAGEIAVRLETERLGSTENGHTLRGWVADTGVGIPPADRLLIFETFHQTPAGERDTTGAGLGLAIASQLVRLMDGHLEVESELGRGSTFHFSVRLPGPDSPDDES